MTAFLRFVNIILAALLAGTSFGIWIGLNPSHYSASTYLEQQLNLVGSLNTLMVLMVIFSTIVTIVVALLLKQNKVHFFVLLAAAACFLACILISRFGNMPIQQEMLTWKPDQLPSNWTAMRDEWWSLHKMRTIAELIALALIAWINIQKATEKYT